MNTKSERDAYRDVQHFDVLYMNGTMGKCHYVYIDGMLYNVDENFLTCESDYAREHYTLIDMWRPNMIKHTLKFMRDECISILEETYAFRHIYPTDPIMTKDEAEQKYGIKILC